MLLKSKWKVFQMQRYLSKILIESYSKERNVKGPSIKYVRKIFRETNISSSLIRTRTCAYQGVSNISFSENFAYVLNGWPLIDVKNNPIFKILLGGVLKFSY